MSSISRNISDYQSIIEANYQNYTEEYWKKSDAQIRDKIKRFYLTLMNKGADEWNKWALELEAFIDENDLDASECTIILTNVDIREQKLENFIFPVNVKFHNLDFFGDTWIEFNNTVFKGLTEFNACVFNNDVNFVEARFLNLTYFIDCTFTKDSLFRSVELEEHVTFRKCTFNSSADFFDSKFFDSASFSNNTFNDDATFSHSIFTDYLEFKNNNFDSSASFTKCIFLKDAKFSNNSFLRSCDFESAEFPNRVPDFNFCNFVQPPFLSKILIPEKYNDHPRSYTENYRRLKSLAIESHDHEQELKFFTFEMKSKMYDFGFNQQSLKFFTLRLYEVSANFGMSIRRPTMGLLLTILLSMTLHFSLLAPINSCKSPSEYSKTEAVFSHVVSYAIPFFLSHSEAEKATNACLFGKGKPPSLNIHYIGVAQALISAIFAFLIGLGIRNRFKIK